MNVKIAIYKSGFLNHAQVARLQERAAMLGLGELQQREAVRDLEMSVYLQWLLKLVSGLPEQFKKELKGYLQDNKEKVNPVVEFLIVKYGKQAILDQVSPVIDAVLVHDGRPTKI